MKSKSSPELVVLVPVLRRPHRVRPVLDAFNETAPGCRILFIPDTSDSAERCVISYVGAEELPVDGNYATKIHAGVQATHEPLIFTGADDLDPRPGWFERAAARLRGRIQVVGINDLLERNPPREHATHFLMTRAYAELPTLDGGPGPFSPAYSSWFCDDELIATAKRRGAYAYAADSEVEHLHPMNDKAPDDETYRAGRLNWKADRRLFNKRARLWM